MESRAAIVLEVAQALPATNSTFESGTLAVRPEGASAGVFWTLGEESGLPTTAGAARERLLRGLGLLDGGDVFLDRYYAPRPEWVWDRTANPRLEAVATLGVFLRWRGSDGAGVEGWLAGYRREGPGVYTAGGAAVLTEPGPGGPGLRFVSGGQDALESLEFVVSEFHEWLREHQDLEVMWQEEPLRYV